MMQVGCDVSVRLVLDGTIQYIWYFEKNLGILDVSYVEIGRKPSHIDLFSRKTHTS
jgi:hypothetical protein